MLCSQQCSSGPNMALSVASNDVREYHFRCLCGERAIATEPMVACAKCGEFLWICPEANLTDLQKLALAIMFSAWLWWCVYFLGHLLRRV
jgi:hypothetical protein